jgi:hypothetical protein
MELVEESLSGVSEEMANVYSIIRYAFRTINSVDDHEEEKRCSRARNSRSKLLMTGRGDGSKPVLDDSHVPRVVEMLKACRKRVS